MKTTVAPSAVADANIEAGRLPNWYSMYGLCVRSDVALPLAPDNRARTVPACIFALATPADLAPVPDGPLVAWLPCYGPCHNGSMVTTVHRGPGGTWFWYDAVGTCHVAPDARRVTVYPHAACDEQALGLMLTGQVMTFVLHKLGFPSLHASAVMIEGEGVAFLGPGGHCKSTLAASFLRRRVTLLTDDVLPLCLRDEVVCAIPGLPIMKVWQQTAEHALHLTDDLPTLTAHFEKRLLTVDERFSIGRTPTPLRAIYLVNRYDPRLAGRADVMIERLGRQERLTALLAQTSNRAYLEPRENSSLLPLYAQLATQVPINVLRYPDGFDYQDLVCARIVADLEEGR